MVAAKTAAATRGRGLITAGAASVPSGSGWSGTEGCLLTTTWKPAAMAASQTTATRPALSMRLQARMLESRGTWPNTAMTGPVRVEPQLAPCVRACLGDWIAALQELSSSASRRAVEGSAHREGQRDCTEEAPLTPRGSAKNSGTSGGRSGPSSWCIRTRSLRAHSLLSGAFTVQVTTASGWCVSRSPR
jgi:hypothetical protein